MGCRSHARTAQPSRDGRNPQRQITQPQPRDDWEAYEFLIQPYERDQFPDFIEPLEDSLRQHSHAIR